MKMIFNPFTRIAGGKALACGGLFILAGATLCYLTGNVQDTYLHFTPAETTFTTTLLRQVAMWFLGALLAYAAGVALSKSRVRLIDVLGTTAFAQVALLPMLALLLIPSLSSRLHAAAMQMAESIAAGAVPQPEPDAIVAIIIYGTVSIVMLIWFFILNYNAFSVSCNVRGIRAAAVYFLTVVAATIISQFITPHTL